MAIDKKLQIFDDEGNPVDYDILASDVKFMPDGKDLPTKLAEMQEEIGEAGQVNEIVMNGQHYTPTDKVIDLGTVEGEQGPAGPQGPTGPQGPQGVQGAQGATGAAGADGKSAYQSYLDTTSDNPKKTEAQWVASLKGADGATGATGPQGPAGPQGNSGVASADGVIVVNNLTEGGTDVEVDGVTKVKVLSAEMGKGLKDLIDLLEARVDDIEDGGGISAVVSGDTLVISSASSPSVSVGSVGNNSLSCKAGNTATTSFLIQGRRLAGNIAIAVSDSTNWSVSPASISPVGGNVATTQVVISYNPAAGTTAGTQHQCTVTVTCDGVTYGTISMNGTVAAAPSIILTPSTLALSTVENEPKAGTINVKGVALEGDIALAISGSGFSLSSATVAKADAESTNGVDVTVTFDGSADGSATITASSTNATNVTAAVTGSLVSRKATGDTFDVGNLRYTVLTDTSQVSVKNNGSTGAVVVPSTVNDENGIGYTVKALAYQAFQGASITSIVLPNTLTITKTGTGGYSEYSQAFKNCYGLVSADLGGISLMYQEFFDNCNNLANVTLRNVTRIYSNSFRVCLKLKKLILPDTIQKLDNTWADGNIEELQIGTSTNCAVTNVWFNKMTGLKKVICYKPTPPTITPVYYDLQYGGGFARGFRNYESGRTTDSSSEVFDTNGTGKVYVPAGSVSAYENASGNAKPWTYIKGDSNLAGDSSGRIYEITDDILLS